MDPSTLAAQALELLQLVGAGIAGGALQGMGEDVHQKAKALVHSLQSRWRDDEKALAVLATSQESPTTLTSQQKDFLLTMLTQSLHADTELYAQAESLVGSAPHLRVTQTMENARDVTGVEAEEFSSGQVDVQQIVQTADGVTGAKVGKIG